MSFKCYLCQKTFSSRKQLLTHERTKHKNNKTIPHLHSLHQPTFEQLVSYQDAYNSVLRKYHYTFKGEAGEGRLKQILNYEYWNCRQDPKTKTTGYVLFVNSEEIYEVSFSWAQNELVENNRIFQCGTVICTFITDSGEFINGNEVTNENQ
ncbi:hypothetical protein GLOIN_2v1475986 [Rhizophagus irregularis DAOM 181602=DAOM 197198]|nr:hypothetical protein GLOIN_2v1475986 [Rhizophagus irregularis DAOM 181602=DAOM 197198]